MSFNFCYLIKMTFSTKICQIWPKLISFQKFLTSVRYMIVSFSRISDFTLPSSSDRKSFNAVHFTFTDFQCRLPFLFNGSNGGLSRINTSHLCKTWIKKSCCRFSSRQAAFREVKVKNFQKNLWHCTGKNLQKN